MTEPLIIDDAFELKLSETGAKERGKMKVKLDKLLSDYIQRLTTWKTSGTSYKLDRFENAVEYWEDKLNNLEKTVQARIAEIIKESKEDREKWTKMLERSKKRLTKEKQTVPVSVQNAQHAYEQLLKKYQGMNFESSNDKKKREEAFTQVESLRVPQATGADSDSEEEEWNGETTLIEPPAPPPEPQPAPVVKKIVKRPVAVPPPIPAPAPSSNEMPKEVSDFLDRMACRSIGITPESLQNARNESKRADKNVPVKLSKQEEYNQYARQRALEEEQRVAEMKERRRREAEQSASEDESEHEEKEQPLFYSPPPSQQQHPPRIIGNTKKVVKQAVSLRS